MTDRDRLIELIKQKQNGGWRFITGEYTTDVFNEHLADYLLANGVIVPPCKVGDTVYTVGVFTGQIIPSNVVGIDYTANDVFLHLENSTFVSVVHQLGKTVFLTKEETEEKLKELNK